MLLRLLTVLLILAPLQAGQRTLLYSPRVSASLPGELPEGEANARLFRQILPEWKPNEFEKELEENRPWVAQHVHGSFTKSGADEELFLIRGSRHVMGTVGNQLDSRILVFSEARKAKLVDQVVEGFVVCVMDVNGDGLLEVLASGGYCWMGACTHNAKLYSYKDAKEKTLDDFGVVDFSRNSWDGRLDSHIVAELWFVKRTGAEPSFETIYYHELSEGSGKWRKLRRDEVLLDGDSLILKKKHAIRP